MRPRLHRGLRWLRDTLLPRRSGRLPREAVHHGHPLIAHVWLLLLIAGAVRELRRSNPPALVEGTSDGVALEDDEAQPREGPVTCAGMPATRNPDVAGIPIVGVPVGSVSSDALLTYALPRVRSPIRYRSTSSPASSTP